MVFGSIKIAASSPENSRKTNEHLHCHSEENVMLAFWWAIRSTPRKETLHTHTHT